MRWCRIPLVLLTLTALTVPLQAGFLFGKKKNPDPAQRVPELLNQVKTDQDEGNRVSAAEELRQYDAKAFPGIVPVLIDVLLNDPKALVRMEAAQRE